MNEPVRQHWVPRAYLRAFCAAPAVREQLFALDLNSGNTFLSSIDRVAVKKHFYTLRRDSPSPSFAVETALERIETAVTPILAQIRSEEVLPTDTRLHVLAGFLGSLYMRSRQSLEAIHGWRRDVNENAHLYSIDMDRRSELQKLSEEEMRELFARSAVVVGERIGNQLMKFVWRLIRAEEGHFFTSENPVFCFHRSETRWGLETPGSHTLFPVSPKLMLHLSPEPLLRGVGTLSATADAVRGLNGLVLLSAEQFLYSDRPFDRVGDLLKDRETGSKRAFGPA